ncbi:BTB/POZ and MATH domain-containing protein 1-like [Miscanthus floridulus]|uniref:BTB/POZ and MATH domain-containing protein 1-like n=1 Tax=Miscanthus floridulus TaxID=154761 RepID=UPI0034594669
MPGGACNLTRWRASGTGWGFSIVKRSDLEPLYVANGWVTIMCGVIVVSNDPKPVPPPPPSDIGLHLGRLLDRSMATDVTFMVGGEAFPAHRAVLAGRSPVFEAQLLGSMADATMPSMSITVQDIHPAAFRAMLRSKWFFTINIYYRNGTESLEQSMRAGFQILDEVHVHSSPGVHAAASLRHTVECTTSCKSCMRET